MNAKELILKKINADTNWVDIYTSGVILGEDINAIGAFMTSSIINDLVSKYNTSAFDTEYIGTKIDFIKKAISEEPDSNKKEAYNELLRRVYIAEELRIMGKILKINQGMPTNLSDLQQYISSIEQYIESRINHVNLENYQNTISQFNELKKRLGLSEELTEGDLNIPEIAKALKQIKKAKEQMTSNWIYFDLVKFVQDSEYAEQMDKMYEGVKVTFNILNTLRQSPHFNEMFKVLGLNNTILTSLSKRNLIERTVWNTAVHKSSKGKAVIQTKLNSTERITLKNLIDDTLADTWIKTNIRNSDGSPVRIIWTVNDKPNVITFDGGFDYKLFIKYIETELIPRLRNNLLVVNGQIIETANNAFIKHLTFGKDRDGNTIFRLPYNMTQIDKNPGIQVEYEKILNAFGQLRGIILDNGLSVVDMFYLYNLIVHKDKFSRSALTRLFEDLIASDRGEQLLVFKFNEWLETVNENEIVSKVLANWGAVHSNTASSNEESVTIGFNNKVGNEVGRTPTDETLHIDSDYIAERERILANATRNSDPTQVYQTNPSKQSKLIEVVRQAREKGIKGLYAVSQSDLINEDIYIRSANGFVRNGEIYINVDRAGDDTVIHEFGHLYLADAKNNNRLAYYALLEKMKDTALWKEMRKWAAYANKIGSDFDEEILATMIGDYYKAEFKNYEYESLAKEALELVDPAFIELLNSEILPDLGDTFITNYYFQQKVSTWKSKLVSDNILKENCL